VIVLFIDTSTDNLSIAVFKNDILLSNVNILSNEHSKNTLNQIEKVLDENNIKPKDVNKIMIIITEYVVFLLSDWTRPRQVKQEKSTDKKTSLNEALRDNDVAV